MLETVRDALAAGFSPSSAATYGAVSEAESDLDPSVEGDVALEDGTWGPSVGEPQIRTLRAATGTGSDRDLQRLLGRPLEQAKAALDISGNGANWSPWTTFRDGAYQQFLPAAQAAVAAAESTPGSPTVTAQPAFSILPSSITDGVKGIVLTGLFVLLGVGLVAAGAITLTQQTKVGQELTKAGIEAAAK